MTQFYFLNTFLYTDLYTKHINFIHETLSFIQSKHSFIHKMLIKDTLKAFGDFKNKQQKCMR